MKRSATPVVLATIIVVCILIVAQVAYSAARSRGRQPGRGTQATQPGMDPYQNFGTAEQPAAPQRITGPDPNETLAKLIGEPNEVRARIAKFEGLEQELQTVRDQARQEDQQWTDARTQSRTMLAAAVEAQIREELMMLRRLAGAEKAEKTAAAIDGLLLARRERFGQVVRQLEVQERRGLRGQPAAPGANPQDPWGRGTRSGTTRGTTRRGGR